MLLENGTEVVRTDPAPAPSEDQLRATDGSCEESHRQKAE